MKSLKPLALTLALFPLLLVADKTPPAKAVDATPQQKEIKAFLVDLFESSKKVNQKGKTRLRSRAKIEGAMHWPTVAKNCLGEKLWKKNPKSRGNFQQLLKEVVSLTAYTRMTSFWDGATYKFTKIDVKGNTANVDVLFEVEDEDDVELSYYLNKKGKRWYIVDLAYEEFKYSENIREQILDYMTDGNFKTLLSKLRKRHETLKAEEKSMRDGKPKAASKKKS